MPPRDSGSAAPHDPITLTDCDREAIHTPGRIQSFGALLAVTPEGVVSQASANAAEFLGLPNGPIVGCLLAELLTPATIDAVQDCLRDLVTPESVDRLFGMRVTQAADLFDVAVHRSDALIVLEFEKSGPHAMRDISSRVRQMVAGLAGKHAVVDLCQSAVDQIRALTGLDRVMAYGFEPDGTGTVIAEAKTPDSDAFLGLRYPATDIPQQARALYKRNLLRVIGDATDAGILIDNPGCAPLDLSLSTTRAVSPIHLEYLRNMGVQASLSVSILRRDGLWGLFACHHGSPHVPSFSMRTALELFSLLFSSLLDQAETDADQAEADRARLSHDHIMAQVAGHGSVRDDFASIVAAIGAVIPHDGAVGWFDGTYRGIGDAPDKAHFLRLMPMIMAKGADAVFATDCLSRELPDATAFAKMAAGMLVLPVSRRPRDFIVLFRRELVQSVLWAGNPSKASDERLTPRKSFATWQESVENHCDHWTKVQVRAAEALRVTLLEVVLRMAENALEKSVRAQEHQEFLIAELNHRMRNILNLIKGVVRQSGEGQKDVAAFTQAIGGRIHALALAHDQVMNQAGSSTSLYGLIATEAAAFLADCATRLVLNGPDVLLEPAAFTTLSLVIHELMTNSVKHGALGTARGQVSITLDHATQDGLAIFWRETGGPVVQPPTRQGFGTTIIERAIPHELSGTVTMRFAPAGLEVDLTVPASAIERFAAAGDLTGGAVITQTAQLPSSVLLVEDNIIIGLDAEDVLRRIGIADIEVVSNVSTALEMLATRSFDFGLLDLNLGAENSLPIAERLRATGIRFAFATGYGKWVNIQDSFADIRVLQKPYNENDLRGLFLGGDFSDQG